MGARTTHPHRRPPLALASGTCALLLAMAGAATASSEPVDEATRDAGARWFSLGVLSGSTRLDDGLADYQWDMTPRVNWGAQALAGRGRFAGGLRLWRTQTTQQIDPADATSAAQVHATSTELVGRGRLATAAGCDVMAVGSVGLLHLGYRPDRVSLAPPGGGAPIAVDLQPINAWIGGAGVAMRRPLRGPWAAGVELDHRLFALDTAHRNGSVIEYGRRTFGDWSARLELAWMSGRP